VKCEVKSCLVPSVQMAGRNIELSSGSPVLLTYNATKENRQKSTVRLVKFACSCFIAFLVSCSYSAQANEVKWLLHDKDEAVYVVHIFEQLNSSDSSSNETSGVDEQSPSYLRESVSVVIRKIREGLFNAKTTFVNYAIVNQLLLNSQNGDVNETPVDPTDPITFLMDESGRIDVSSIKETFEGSNSWADVFLRLPEQKVLDGVSKAKVNLDNEGLFCFRLSKIGGDYKLVSLDRYLQITASKPYNDDTGDRLVELSYTLSEVMETDVDVERSPSVSAVQDKDKQTIIGFLRKHENLFLCEYNGKHVFNLSKGYLQKGEGKYRIRYTFTPDRQDSGAVENIRTIHVRMDAKM